MKQLLVFSGSLRKDSWNTKLTNMIAQEFGTTTNITLAKFDDFPLFSEDLEKNYPTQVQRLKDQVIEADAIIFATPEYNRSIPGALKNAIDWLSRPYGTQPFGGKPVLLLGATPGSTGTMLAQNHLRTVMSFLDAKIIAQPELYVGSVMDKWDPQTNSFDKSTVDHVKKGVETLLAL